MMDENNTMALSLTDVARCGSSFGGPWNEPREG